MPWLANAALKFEENATMAFIRRVSRLFAADLHAVLDRVEAPDALLKQAVREMEDELVKGAQRLKALERERAMLLKRGKELQATLGEIEGKLDLCFAAGNDDLARKLTRRKLLTTRLGQRLEENIEALDEDLAERRTTLASQQDQLELMRQKAELFAAEDRAPFDDVASEHDAVIGDDELEVAFLQEKQAREQK